MTYEELRAKARDELSRGDAHAAFSTFRPAIEYPGLLDTDVRWADALGLFALIAGALAGEPFEKLVRETASKLNDSQALYDLGYEMIEQGLNAAAATVLARADRLAPGQEAIVSELVAALERSGRHDAVCELLRRDRALLDSSFMLSYLFAFNAVMTGDLEAPRAELPLLRSLADDSQTWGAARIERYLARADLVRGVSSLDDRDLRGWHFVLTGGLLLHLSPYGFDEGMRGRYAFLQDSESTCAEAIRRVQHVLDAWGTRPANVFALPDRSSAILAEATSRILGAPLAPWPSTDSGLIVAYDLAALDDIESLRQHRPGQLLWSHACCWTQDSPIAADLVTLLYQSNTPPWEPHLIVDPETRKARKSDPEKGSTIDLGARLAALPIGQEALADLPVLGALARVVLPLAAPMRNGGSRERQFESSPVKSSRFL